MNDIKELEKQGCKAFVCPNISLIDDVCKEYNISENIIKTAKNIAIEYFKKTYHNPPFSSAMHVLPSAFYMASRLEGRKMSQIDVGHMFNVSHVTVKKWYENIMFVLDIKNLNKVKRIYTGVELEIEFDKFKDKEFCEIDKIGKELSLKNSTIERAKNIAFKYFKRARISHRKCVRSLRPTFLYTASIIENDGLRQLDVAQKLGIAESIIASWHRRVLKVLGLKIIAHHGRTIQVIEEQYNDID